MSELLTTEQAAAYLRVTAQSVRAYILSGRLAAEKIGRQHRIRPEALEAFLADQRGR